MTTRILGMTALGCVLMMAATGVRLGAQANSAPAAVVNGEPISLDEVDGLVRYRAAALPQATEEQKQRMRYEAVGILIDDRLLRQFLELTMPNPPADEVNRRFNELTRSMTAQGKTLADFCKETNQTEAGLRRDVADQLRWDAWVKQHLPEEMLRKYYEENKDFFDQILVRASHIVLRVSPQTLPSEREAMKTRLRTLRIEILSGRLDFAEAARRHSQCPSGPNGGDISYFPRKFAVEENIAAAAFKLKVGEISDVVETEYGLHLIQVTDRKPGVPSEYGKVKDAVLDAASFEKRLAIVNEQRKRSKVTINIPSPNAEASPNARR
jgi:peptidyl-prolyl cis-trans isomerase C